MAAQEYLRVEEMLESTPCQCIYNSRFPTQRIRRAHMIDDKSALFEQSPIATRRKPAKMRRIHDTPALIFPLPSQQHAQHTVMTNIRRSRQNNGAGFKKAPQFPQDRAG